METMNFLTLSYVICKDGGFSPQRKPDFIIAALSQELKLFYFSQLLSH